MRRNDISLKDELGERYIKYALKMCRNPLRLDIDRAIGCHGDISKQWNKTTHTFIDRRCSGFMFTAVWKWGKVWDYLVSAFYNRLQRRIALSTQQRCPKPKEIASDSHTIELTHIPSIQYTTVTTWRNKARISASVVLGTGIHLHVGNWDEQGNRIIATVSILFYPSCCHSFLVVFG